MAPPISRLLFFVGASIATHALTLGAYTPAGGTVPAVHERSANTTVLHAMLAPQNITAGSPTSNANPSGAASPLGESQHSDNLQDELPNDESAATSEAPARQTSGLDFPVPARWYTAEELDARAEPLAPVKLGYPFNLAGSRIAGRVLLALFIDESGVVRKAQVVTSRPDHTFDEAAIKAWQEIRFLPAQKDGQPVKSEKRLELDFIPE